MTTIEQAIAKLRQLVQLEVQHSWAGSNLTQHSQHWQ